MFPVPYRTAVPLKRLEQSQEDARQLEQRLAQLQQAASRAQGEVFGLQAERDRLLQERDWLQEVQGGLVTTTMAVCPRREPLALTEALLIDSCLLSVPCRRCRTTSVVGRNWSN